MAYQKGLINLEGRIDNLTFYQTKYGMVARKRTGVSGERIKKDPAFVRARENMSEFGRSGKVTKLIRAAFITYIRNYADDRFTQRLVQTIMRITKSDPINDRGDRKFVNGDVAELLSLQFNSQTSLRQSFQAPFTSSVNRHTGSLTVEVPDFTPSSKVGYLKGATHFRLMAVAAELDFDAMNLSVHEAITSDLLIGPQVENVKLICQLPPESTKVLVGVFGIQFGQVNNGKFSPLNSSEHNAIEFIQIDKPSPSASESSS